MGLNIVDNKVESHWHVNGLIRVLTVASWIQLAKGPKFGGEFSEGSQFSSQILIECSFPTLHFAHRLITSLPFKMLFHA